MASQAALVSSVAPGVDLADPSRGIGARHVEIAQRHVAQRIHRRHIAQHPFAHELGGAVGIDGTRRRLFARIAVLGHAVHRRGGGKHELFHAVLETGLQQAAGRAGVVAVVLERQRHGFGHDGVGGEMHDGIDSVLRQQPRDQHMISDIADHQFAGGHRLAKALPQVIEDDDLLAGLAQLPDHVAADVAGPAGDQDGVSGQMGSRCPGSSPPRNAPCRLDPSC